MTHPVPNVVYTQSTGSASTNIFITELQSRDPTVNDTQLPINKRWINTQTLIEFILLGLTPSNGVLEADWRELGQTSNDVNSIQVDAATAPGTDPVLPTALGVVTITGGQVATGTIGANVIRTDSLAANTFTIEIQRTTAVAATDSTKNGVSHFNSSMFSVDSSGFVSLSGGGQAIDSFTPDTGTSPVVPTVGGNVAIRGQATPNISGIRVTGGTNELDFAMFSPFEGDFSFTQSSAASATNRKLTILNADTTNAASNAQIIANVGGTSSGDAHSVWSIASSRAYSLGPDTSDSSILKLTTAAAISVTPSTGTTLLTCSSSGNIQVVAGDFDVIRSNSGGGVSSTVANSSNTASSNAHFIASVAGTTAADPYNSWNVGATRVFSLGIDTSASQVLKLTTDTSSTGNPSAGTTLFQVDGGATLANFFVDELANSKSNNGTPVTIHVANTSNTASSSSILKTSIFGATAKDAYTLYEVFGINSFSTGILGSDQTYRIAPSNSGLGTNDSMIITQAGEVTFPKQPAFLATHTADQNNVTGNGTNVTINFTTEIFDQGSDYDGTNTFTAPVTGRYRFNTSVRFDALDATSDGGATRFITSNRTYESWGLNYGAVRQVTGAGNAISVSHSIFADMDAADTCLVQVEISGMVGDTVDIVNAPTSTYFGGQLEC